MVLLAASKIGGKLRANMHIPMNAVLEPVLQIEQIAKLFTLSEESTKRPAKNHGFILRRLTPYATAGVLQVVERKTMHRCH